MRAALWMLLVPCVALADAKDDLAARAAKVHRDAIVIDTHLDAPDQLADKWADIADKGSTDHFDIPRARTGGLTAPFFSIYVSASYAQSGGAAARALTLIDLTRRVVDGHPKDMTMASSVADIRAAKQAGKIGVLMGIEGGHAIEDSLAVLREMYRAGVRYMTLTHTNTNHWADSSGPFYEPDFDPKKSAIHGGLSGFGNEVVKEMNRLGMIVDVSHVSDATVDDVLAVSRAPVMASHSSCKAIANMPRNLTDDQIKRIVAKGGMININFGSMFLDQKGYDGLRARLAKIKTEWAAIRAKYKADPQKAAEARRALYKSFGAPYRTQWTTVVDHIEHAIKVAGEDAVGLGTDYDGVGDPPIGLDDVSLLPKLTEELLRRGHSEARVKKVLGENFLAFFARVEATRASLAKELPSPAVYKK
ncbi:MAG: membrane dipeptidase [Deltaproteobacteria bacterium]|nr:membrane dipeptidase [Deltaproteobacteria bacterium]